MPDIALPADAPSTFGRVTFTRQPALPGFIVRRLFAAAAKPGRQTVIEACRAELDWSRADFTRMSRFFDSHVEQYDGPHPEQAYRLPHEQAAARVLNCWGHVQPLEQRIREASVTLKAQRQAANDATQSNAYRNSWAVAAGHTAHGLAAMLKTLRHNYPIFLKAVRDYRAARAELGTCPLCKRPLDAGRCGGKGCPA